MRFPPLSRWKVCVVHQGFVLSNVFIDLYIIKALVIFCTAQLNPSHGKLVLKIKYETIDFFNFTFSRIKKPQIFMYFNFVIGMHSSSWLEEVKVMLKLLAPTSFPCANTER